MTPSLRLSLPYTSRPQVRHVSHDPRPLSPVESVIEHYKVSLRGAKTIPSVSVIALFHSIPQTAAAGGLTITKPPSTATSYFKIAPDDQITFGWNFTYLYVTPASLTVSALCDNGYTYPVGPTDGIIPGDATSLVWDPYAYNQAHPELQLPQAMYTLGIWDSRGPGAAREGGVFNPNTQLTFALYTTQGYTPLASGE